MPDKPTILHLVDDATAGGVMRVVDHIVTSPQLAQDAVHITQQVARGRPSAKRYDADVIVSHLSISWRNLPMLMALKASNAGRRLIHVEHTYTESFVALNVARRRRFDTLLRVSYALFDTVVAVSEGQAAWLRHRSYCPPDKLQIIQSCVDLAPFAALPPRAARRDGPTVLGAIGRLDRQKGFDTLIQTFKALDRPDLELRIYGEGEEETALRNLASGDPRITFCGFASDPTRPVAAVDAVVMPSRWEAYGLVAIEALAANRALIAADIDGLADHAEWGAQLYPAYHVSGLQMALETPPPADRNGGPAMAATLQARFIEGWRAVLAGDPAPVSGDLCAA